MARTPSPNAAEGIVEYHEQSKHHLDRHAPGPGGLDWANQPDPFRRYAGCPSIALPFTADRLAVPFQALRQMHRQAPLPVTRDTLALLLELSLGLSAWKSFMGNRWALRCNPSSGNLHPTEGYLVCRALRDLPGGVHHYVSYDHRLERRARPDTAAWDEGFPPNGVLAGISSIYWREAWKYGVRAYRYCQQDAGHALAALRYAAAALGWKAALLDGWSDEAIATLLGIDRESDRDGAEAEAPDFLVWIGHSEDAPDPDRLLGLLDTVQWSGRANRLSLENVRWPLIDQAHAAAYKPPTAPPEPFSVEPRPKLIPHPPTVTAASLIRQRRSAIEFDAVTSLSAVQFFGMLDALMPRDKTPPWDVLPWPARIHPALFVHRINGLTPGLYVLPRRKAVIAKLRDALDGEFSWKKVDGCPHHIPLYLLLSTDLQRAAATISCHQDIAANSAFSLGMLAEFSDPIGQGAWWYRRLHWEAGVLGQVLYLEAEAHGVRATGIGCFFDDAMHRLLGLENNAFQTLYHFTVGGPVEDTRLTTLPPYAHVDR